MRRIAPTILFIGLCSSALPESVVIDGKRYDDVQWGRVTEMTVSIKHRNGVGKIPLSRLSPELQRRFGYDPSKAPPEASTPVPPPEPVETRWNAPGLMPPQPQTPPLPPKPPKAAPEPPAPTPPPSGTTTSAPFTTAISNPSDTPKTSDARQAQDSTPQPTETRDRPKARSDPAQSPVSLQPGDPQAINEVLTELKRLYAKLREIAQPPPKGLFVHEIIRRTDMFIKSGADGEFQIASDLMRDNQPYSILWSNNRFTIRPLTESEVSISKLKPGDVGSKMISPLEGASSTPKLNVLTADAAFDCGFQYYIEDVSIGTPPGTVRVGQKVPGRLRLTSRSTTNEEFVVLLEMQFGPLSSQMYAYPKVAPDTTTQELNFEYGTFSPIPKNLPKAVSVQMGEETVAVLTLLTRPPVMGQGPKPRAPLSNSVSVPLKILE